MTSPAERVEALHDVIKRETADAHAHVERRVNLDIGWTLDRYERFLRASLAAVVPAESELGRHLSHADFPLLLSGATRIRADLSQLGRPADVVAGSWQPSAQNLSEAFGIAYVLLGSLLGGRIIAKHLQPRLALEDAALRYLRPEGDLGAEWKRFTAAMNDSPLQPTETVSAALTTFGAFDAAFAGEGF